MRKVTICPSFIDACSPQEAVDILFEFPRSSARARISVDSELEIFRRYALAEDANGLIKSWIAFLVDLHPQRLYKIGPVKNAEALSNQELCVEISSKLQRNRGILVDDVEDYSDLSEKILLANIELLERRDAGEIFREVRNFDFEKLTDDLLVLAHRLTERKYTMSVENLHNDLVVDMLRNRSYQVYDQTRTGSSTGGKDAGEADILFRSVAGRVESIIESFRLSSCGPKNMVVLDHLHKLVNLYDTTAVRRSFIFVYAEAKNFASLWKAYCAYMKKLLISSDWQGDAPPVSFEDLSRDLGCNSSVRAGRAEHRRDMANLEVYHFFINVAV